MYELIKQAHFIAIFIWLVSMTGALFALKMNAKPAVAGTLRLLMTVGIMLTWGLGAYLAYAGEHYLSLWFWVKFAIVFLLSGVHGKIAGNLRKNIPFSSYKPVFVLGLLTLVSVAAILHLALVKPF